MMRGLALVLAAVLGLQPALADGLTAKAKRELAASEGVRSTIRNTTRPRPPACSGSRTDQARCRLVRSHRASRTSPSCRAPATTSWSATAWSSDCRARATACAIRLSPNSRSAPCSKISASPPRAAAPVPRTSPPSSSPPTCRPSSSRAPVSTSTSPRWAMPHRLPAASLVMTPLKAADGEIYAVGQGSVIVSGFAAQGQAEQLTQGVPTAGRVPNGAIVERAVQAEFDDQAALTLQLRNPDFSTAVRIADAINDYSAQRFGMRVAAERDARTVQIKAAEERFGGALLCRDREPGRRIGHAGARRHRRADRHDRHRQRGQDLEGRHQPRHAHRAHHRGAAA